MSTQRPALGLMTVRSDSNAANDWLKQTPVSFPIVYDKESQVSKLYDVAGMPSTVPPRAVSRWP